MSGEGGGGFWARLTPRERTYLLVLVLVFFVMGTLVLFYLRGNALRAGNEEVLKIRMAIDAVHTRGAVYTAKLEAKKERERAISTECVQFASLLDEARSAVEAISIANEEEDPPVDLGSGLTKCSYKFDVRNTTLEDLTKLLAFLESKPGHIIVTEGLRVRSPSSAEDRLNADVVLVTFRREGGEGEDLAVGGDDKGEEGAP